MRFFRSFLIFCKETILQEKIGILVDFSNKKPMFSCAFSTRFFGGGQ